jgi:hypothetical protein
MHEAVARWGSVRVIPDAAGHVSDRMKDAVRQGALGVETEWFDWESGVSNDGADTTPFREARFAMREV